MDRMYRFLFASAVIAATSALCSCSNTDFTRDSQQRTPSYGATSFAPTAKPDTGIVAVGDSLTLSVWDYPQFNTRATVKLNGVVSIPLIGDMKVAGYTRDELTRMLRRRLSDYLKGDILLSLEVTSPAPKITVLGMVPRQGSYPANNELPLLEVLSLAGGWTEFADPRYIKITRQSTLAGERPSVEVDLTAFMETGDLRGLPMVRPGDVVFVPKKENYVREFSEFMRDVFLLFGFFRIFD